MSVMAIAMVMTIAAVMPTFAITIDDSNSGPAFDMTSSSKTYFEGEELMMLSNQTASQMNSFVLTTKNGSIIVVDGGTPGDAAYLRQVLASKGNHVSAWFITHPHSDHIGALTQIIEEGLNGLTIDNIYYHFTYQDWYNQKEPARADFVARATNAFATLGGIPKVMRKGNTFTIDSAVVTVMNDPYLVDTNPINNTSVVLKVVMGGKTIMFLGDLDTNAQGMWLNDHAGEDLHCDIVQLSHHGQSGVNEDFYRVLSPKTALWCAPAWLYDNEYGKYRSDETKRWLRALGVTDQYIIKNGDQILK